MSVPPREAGDDRLFAKLAGIVLTGQSFSDLLDHIVDMAVSVVGATTGASVSAVHRERERLETTNATSREIRHVDEAQYEECEGPCVEAIRTGEEIAVRIPIEQWPRFNEAAMKSGVRSVFSLPLSADGRTLGALNLYSATDVALPDADVRVARSLAAQAGVVVANAAALAVAEITNQQLQEALETRDLIGQAKGILMAREGIDADAAFDVLRRASQRSNRKLRDIAAEIVRPTDPGSTR